LPERRQPVQALLDEALGYAGRRWPVFPVYEIGPDGKCACGGRPGCSPGKHPRSQNGLKDATTDEATIRRWWEMWPQANIGLVTGAPSGLVVLDIDPKNGGDVALADLLGQHGPLPETAQTRTGSGGQHFLFAHPGSTVRNSTGKLGRGLDIKADGGYIVAPPSQHASGEEYAWIAHPDATERAPLPGWLMGLLTREERPRQRPLGVPGAIVEGQRDNTLFALASSLCGQGRSEDEILQELRAVNAARCEPTLGGDQVRKIARQAARYPPGFAQPTRWPTIPVYSVEELLALPDPEWLIESHLEAGSTAVLYGPPGAGKTFVALDMALSVAAGLPWLGQYPVKQGRAVYVVGENVHGIAMRVRAWQTAHPGADLADFGVVPRPVRLLDETEAEALISRLVGEPPALVIVDTLARCFDGDENSAKDMGRLVRVVEQVSQETGAAVVVVHHVVKDGKAERGNGALRGAVDTMLSLRRVGGVSVLECNKQRNAEEADEVSLCLTKVEGSAVFELARGDGRTDRLDAKALVHGCLSL
jgi:Bifunctional DNA primase/polymerase, N-terminal/AAA domain/Primase C terminal 1 (PriCT-1)